MYKQNEMIITQLGSNEFLIEKFTSENRFIILAEHKTRAAAEADLEMWKAA